MKQYLLIILTLIAVNNMNAQNIKLPEPNKTGGLSIQEDFSKRRGYRDGIDSRKLSEQQISDLLWSANGVNREDGKRTAPSAKDLKGISVYAIIEDGAYLYDANRHELILLTTGDYRKAAGGGQTFVDSVPIVLIMASDYAIFDETEKSGKYGNVIPVWPAIDAGIVSQNISMFCAGNGLATLTRVSMDQKVLREVLKLRETQHLLVNNAVGYPIQGM